MFFPQVLRLSYAFGDFYYEIMLPVLLKIREDVPVFLFAQLALPELSGRLARIST
jgi:hypothetical protein